MREQQRDRVCGSERAAFEFAIEMQLTEMWTNPGSEYVSYVLYV